MFILPHALSFATVFAGLGLLAMAGRALPAVLVATVVGASAYSFVDLLTNIEKRRAELDEALKPFLDREVDLVDPIERAVLRLGAYELIHRIDVPYRVVINEAIETTKRFGADFGHTYVNGVLDKLAAQSRGPEYRR